ncbi:MAG: hypothetical protein LJE84_13630 [Gammaproteobacteria bacterium]|nr:hypothetical protein [Gammaproteobacteria bacterium]
MPYPNSVIPIFAAALALCVPYRGAVAGEVDDPSMHRQIREQGDHALGQLNRKLVRADWQRRAARELAVLLGHRTLLAGEPGARAKSQN